MEFQHLILLVCIWTVHGYPSRPLNDRPGELAWQAWLLVDSQNQPTEGDRRITPKSVFIAPKLGQKNDTLPDCAEGYQADQMGRCIKFVKVDQAAHLNFLLQRLNALYATKPNAEESEDGPSPTSGPLQVNIPLGTGYSSGEEPDTNPEIAIIVAPTNGNFDVDDDDGKVNVKRTNFNVESSTQDADKLEDSQFFLGERTQSEEETGGYDGEEDLPDDRTEAIMDEDAREESSTKLEDNNSERAAEQTQADIIKMKEVTTGANEEETEESVTTTERPPDNLQALFFRVPIVNASHVQNNRSVTPTGAPVPPPNTIRNSTPLMSDTEPSALPIKAKLDTETQPVEDLATLIEPVYPHEHQLSSDLRDRQHLIRFPDENPVRFTDQSTERLTIQRPSSFETHSLTNDEIEQLFQEFIHEGRNPDNGQPFRKRPNPRYPLENSQIQRPSYDGPFNHRNRDRNSDFWKIPPEPREQISQKPLVLRFEKQPSNTRYNTELYYPQESSYYEETTRTNTPNLFPRRSRRNHFR